MIDRSVITFIILVVVTTIVICIVSYIISKLIVAPLQTVSRMMERAKEGDLTVHGDYNAKDELGVLVSNFNEMIAGLRTNMQEVENNIQLLFQHADGVVSASEVSSSAAKKSLWILKKSQMVQRVKCKQWNKLRVRWKS